MKTASAQQMREIDRQTIENFGIGGDILMETAGLSVVRAIAARFPGKRALIFCGSGNNGGDGMVIARHLNRLGTEATVLLLGKPREPSRPLEILKKTGGAVLHAGDCGGSFSELLKETDLVVDAILGTGTDKPVTGVIGQAIEEINGSGKPVVSVDIPSGIDGNSGHIMGRAVKADLTVAIGLVKHGLLLAPGTEYAGRIEVADIGFPSQLTDSPALTAEITPPKRLISMMPRRDRSAYKGSSGKLLAVCGSAQYTGAPRLVCRSAMRTGCGMVYLMVPENAAAAVSAALTETVVVPYTHATYGGIIDELAEKCSVLALGSGLGRSELSLEIMEYAARRLRLEAVIDGDALDCGVLKNSRFKNSVLTPHAGEMGRILNIPAAQVLSDPMQAALQAARQYHAAALMKGPNSIIASPEGLLNFNVTGSQTLATAGSGDVLTGIISGLLAQGAPCRDAAVLGAFIHGACGTLAAAECGRQGTVASDLIPCIPRITELLLEGKEKELEKFIPIGQTDLCL